MVSADDKLLKRELGRRRVFFFVSIFFALALGGLIPEEGDMLLHVLDEYAIVTISIVAIILLLAWRNKQSLAELKKQHNIIFILFIVALIFKLYAFTVEAGDPQDFGDEIPVAIGLIMTLANRFV
jgi:membrane-bound acyltransferase YfiQ involved in biofilm formation